MYFYFIYFLLKGFTQIKPAAIYTKLHFDTGLVINILIERKIMKACSSSSRCTQMKEKSHYTMKNNERYQLVRKARKATEIYQFAEVCEYMSV